MLNKSDAFVKWNTIFSCAAVDVKNLDKFLDESLTAKYRSFMFHFMFHNILLKSEKGLKLASFARHVSDIGGILDEIRRRKTQDDWQAAVHIVSGNGLIWA